MTPKEAREARRKRISILIGNTIVLVAAIGGVLLAGPWQQYRNGYVPQFVSPGSWLELVFAVVIGLGIIYGVQELGGDPVGKHKRLGKRCIMAFMAGAGSRVLIGG